jgi:hypothetical protein
MLRLRVSPSRRIRPVIGRCRRERSTDRSPHTRAVIASPQREALQKSRGLGALGAAAFADTADGRSDTERLSSIASVAPASSEVHDDGTRRSIDVPASRTQETMMRRHGAPKSMRRRGFETRTITTRDDGVEGGARPRTCRLTRPCRNSPADETVRALERGTLPESARHRRACPRDSRRTTRAALRPGEQECIRLLSPVRVERTTRAGRMAHAA